MGEFTGSNCRVRCTDCSHLSGHTCSKKNSKVALRKRRTCAVYSFKGEYENRESMPGRYIPTLDKKSRRFLKRMYELGISPVTQDEKSGYKKLPMPQSTATAKVVGTKDLEDVAMYEDPENPIDPWGPESEDGPDNSGG